MNNVSVLARASQRLLIAAIVVGFAACSRGSAEYRHIKDLPWQEWNNYAITMPIERRLDLHKEIRERSGHNPQMTIRSSFESQPQETYRAIVRRIKSGDKSRYYLDVIYAIDESGDFKICNQADRKVIQDYLSGLISDPGSKHPDFYSC